MIAAAHLELRPVPAPSQREIYREGILPFLQPLFRWEVSQPGNVLRVFEEGGRKPFEMAWM